MKNPYEVLGVAPSATADEIRKAYRAMAKKLHPDLNPGDKAAEEKFKEVSGAHDLVGDAEKRRRFDAGEIDEAGNEKPPQHFYRNYADQDDSPYASTSGFADYMDGDDVLADLLRRSRQARANRRGQDLHFVLPIDLAESIAGGTKRLTLPEGGTLDVTIPPGMIDGQTLRLKGKGAPGAGTGGPGDALIRLDVEEDRRFTREGDDLTVELPISLKEAVLGGQIHVPTPTGEVIMTVPKGANTGTTLRLRGKGAPRREGGQGDEFVRLKIVLPKPPDPALEAFVASWNSDFNPREERA